MRRKFYVIFFFAKLPYPHLAKHYLPKGVVNMKNYIIPTNIVSINFITNITPVLYR